MDVALEPPIQRNDIFSEEELAKVHKRKVPDHVAVIMDGNRRWARELQLPSDEGHRKGAQALSSIVEAAVALGIRTLTVFSFSTENWKRSPAEIRALMGIFKQQLVAQQKQMLEQGVRFHVIGDPSKLPFDLQQEIGQAVEYTQEGQALDLILALNYGGRDEMARAMRRIAQDCIEDKLVPSAISETLIGQYLDTAAWKDPELLIRTSGEHRISNFMLWQVAYSEVVVRDVLWPNFTPQDLLSSILEYQQRELRYGK